MSIHTGGAGISKEQRGHPDLFLPAQHPPCLYQTSLRVKFKWLFFFSFAHNVYLLVRVRPKSYALWYNGNIMTVRIRKVPIFNPHFAIYSLGDLR